MKKTLKLLAAATLIALTTAACQKEQLSDNSAEGAESVTFTVQTEVGTKAVADEDGLAAKIDQVLVAVYMKDGDTFRLYDEPVATYTASNKQATFSVNLIRKQTYKIVVWAQKEGAYVCTEGLQSIVRSPAKASVCNDDELDAFYASHEYVQGSATASTSIHAKRPFAQLNLITKDLRTGFEPSNVTVTYVSDTKFNALTGLSSEPAATAVTYSATQPNYKAQGKTLDAAKNTLVMNYLFAPETEQIVLPSVKMKAQLTEVVDFEVSNVPVKRNYRTNVIGNLLTEQTDFTITVVPTWGDSEINVESVATVAAANAALQAGKTNVAIESVESNSVILLPETPNTIGISLPSGNANAVTIKYETSNESGQTPNLNVTAENNTGNLVINAPQSHVTLNGATYNNVTASTSNTTLIVEEGVTINTLTINAGGLEIHGTVTELVIAEGADVKVRDCEGLSQDVYNVAKNFLAPGYVGTKTGGKWNIALSKYWAERVAEVPVGYIENQTEKTVTISTPEALAWMAHRLNVDKFSFSKYTISITEDIDLSAAYWKPAGGNGGARFQGTFDGGNHTISGMEIIENNSYGNAFFGDMSGSPVIKNITFDKATVQKGYPQYSGNVYGIVAAYCYGDVLFENVHVTNSKLFGFGKVGCILGMAADPGTHVTRMHNCSVTNTSVWYVYNASYFAGLIQNQADMQNLTITNCSRYCGINARTLDTKAYNGEESVDVKGEYWEYPDGDEVYMFAAWGDYYTDYHYEGWSLTDLGSNYYLSDGLCHNEI